MQSESGSSHFLYSTIVGKIVSLPTVAEPAQEVEAYSNTRLRQDRFEQCSSNGLKCIFMLFNVTQAVEQTQLLH